MKKRPLIVITGPTAVGKTDVSVTLAKHLDTEIVSADSMQVYRHMDIGTAKVTPAEMCGVKHYLIDVIEPVDEFNVVIFKKMAEEALEKIYSKGKIPVVAGGTGFYIQALIKNVDFIPEKGDTQYRNELKLFADTRGNKALHEELKRKDPLSAAAIPENNVKRVIRALEFYRDTGESLYRHNAREKEKEDVYDVRYFVLTRERTELYARINSRVDKMFSGGLFDEVLALKKSGVTSDMTSMQGIGYREFFDLEGKIISEGEGRTLEDATEEELSETAEKIKIDTRHFAKRQLTWFRHERNIIPVNRDENRSSEECSDFILKRLEF